MKRIKLFIFDVNTLVGAFIVSSDTNAKAFDKARISGRIITSRAIQSELAEVFLRPKLDRFVGLEDRIGFLAYLDRQFLVWPAPIQAFQACRDPKDANTLSSP